MSNNSYAKPILDVISATKWGISPMSVLYKRWSMWLKMVNVAKDVPKDESLKGYYIGPENSNGKEIVV